MALDAETVETKANYLLPGSMAKNRIPDWPPDVFCLCAAILQNSGAYSRVIDDVGSKSKSETSKQRASRLEKAGLAWKKSFGSGTHPETVSNLWTEIFKGKASVLSDLGSDDASVVRNGLLELLAIADEACSDLGIYKLDPKLRDDGGLGAFRFEAENLFVKSMSAAGGATLCKGIHASRARVLPKMHTPQSGLTIRSLSHHLGYRPEIWTSHHSNLGVSLNEFEEYFRGTDTGCAIFFKQVEDVSPGVALSEIRSKAKGFHPPQFFKRLEEGSPVLNLFRSRLVCKLANQ